MEFKEKATLLLKTALRMPFRRPSKGQNALDLPMKSCLERILKGHFERRLCGVEPRSFERM